ncbi:MAG: hypothetical protein JSS55_12265 [Proteobacteria bacterium]|nr:hypothetical protein [Pseudomonadota bacterium]
MRDEHDDRIYQAFRHDLATNVADIVNSIAYAFDRLHERLYGAPWSQQTRANDRRCETKLTAR